MAGSPPTRNGSTAITLGSSALLGALLVSSHANAAYRERSEHCDRAEHPVKR